MYHGPSKLIRAVERNDEFKQLQEELTNELNAGGTEGGPAYRRVVEGTAAALAPAKFPESTVSLSAECVILLEDIAKFGRDVYPWPVVKLLLLVVWTQLFDEVYELEESTTGSMLDKNEFAEERRACLATLTDVHHPPITLQRLCEIPLKQPYLAISKLLHAYRKVALVRALMPRTGVKPAEAAASSSEGEESANMKAVVEALCTWANVLDRPGTREWEDDAWLGFWEYRADNEQVAIMP
ncbi:uncharacterized protein BcabD6B2_31410 [Babesia caballi]|uniref:Uncharacterized protein n=1 Tax=Babesia caballi TaxID=5871 RepID=A0AAV4LU53_BABCB|nr:hypothetical protein BcabD6B2_31410 [Babesia caballi]